MNEVKKQKLRMFANDEMMSDCVRDVLLQQFLKPHIFKEVNMLAAARLAVDLLQDGWKEIEKHRTEKPESTGTTGNVGL